MNRRTIVTLWGKDGAKVDFTLAPLADVGDGAEPSDLDPDNEEATDYVLHSALLSKVLTLCNAALIAGFIYCYYIRLENKYYLKKEKKEIKVLQGQNNAQLSLYRESLGTCRCVPSYSSRKMSSRHAH